MELLDFFLPTAQDGTTKRNLTGEMRDTLDAYDEEPRKSVQDNAVLQFSPGGNAFFGRARNKGRQEKEKNA